MVCNTLVILLHTRHVIGFTMSCMKNKHASVVLQWKISAAQDHWELTQYGLVLPSSLIQAHILHGPVMLC